MRRRARYGFALLCGALLLGAAKASAQRAVLAPGTAFGGTQVIHEQWTVADGLPVNSINQLVQTGDGYLWAATFDGLVRFDGVKFTVFNSANSPALPSNRIQRLTEGAPNELWLVTEQLHLVRYRNNRFTVVVASDCPKEPVYPLVHTEDGGSYIGTCTGLLYLAKDADQPARVSAIRGSVRSVARLRDGSVAVGLADGGVMRVMRHADGHFESRPHAADSAVAALKFTALYQDESGALWGGANGSGVWTERQGRWQRIRLNGDRDFRYVWNIRENPAQSGVAVYGVLTTDNSRFPSLSVLATSTGDRLVSVDTGVSLFAGAQIWTSGRTLWFARSGRLRRDGADAFTLGQGAVFGEVITRPYDINTGLTDHEGSIWLGTFADGLHRIKPAVFRTISEAEGLTSRNALGTYVDRGGNVWVGSWGNGFSRVNPLTGAVQRFGGTNGAPEVARTFLEARDGTMWIGGSTKLYRCRVAPVMRCQTLEVPGVWGLDISALHEDADGRLWIGHRNGLLQVAGDRLVPLDTSSGAPHTFIRAFARSRDGALWMASASAGVIRYREGVFTTITTADGLPSDVIRALRVDRDGFLWIGTEGRGLARLDPRAWTRDSGSSASKRIATINVRTGLFDDGVHEILIDDDDRLWMSSNRGIFWVDRAEASAVAEGRAARVQSTGYSERDGMRNREANGGVQPSGARGLDGRLWFPTQDGVVVVDPKRTRSTAVPVPVLVEQVVSGDSTILPDRGAVQLSPTQRDIRIDFTALTFLEPRNVHFRYRLEGYNDDWVDNDTKRSAYFTKLPPGRYTFRVQASGPRRGWQEPGAILGVVVEPRVFETAWFRGGGAVAALLLLLRIAQRRSREARQRARELERLVHERTLTLQLREQQLEEQNQTLEVQARELLQLDTAKSRFFANVSHELRTPLTLMVAPLDRLRDHHAGSEHDRWLDLAQRNAKRLLELVNQLLDVAKLEAGAMRLAPRLFDVSALLQGALDGFRLAAERKQLQLVADVPLECQVTLDSDALEKIVTNLLSNAVKFTPPGGVITVELRRDATGISLAVANTGPAIPPAQLALVFERFYQVDESQTAVQPGTGIGLSLVKELVELLNGTIAVQSDDRSTTFTVQVPVRDRHPDPLTIAAARNVSGPILLTAVAQRDERELDVPTLLVVDDSQDMRRFVRAHFDERFRVLEAGDGEEALTLARSQLPDVIISDVMMPRMDGRELVRRLRDSPDTDFLAVLLLTAQADNEQRIAGLEGGADDYLGKPFEMRELMARVGNLIAARRRLQLRFEHGANGRSDATVATGDPGAAVTASAPPSASPSAGADGLSDEDRAYREKLLATIYKRLGDEEFGVGELADAMAQDRSHLFRRVRQVTGQAPSDLLRRLRVEEGARLLRTTTGSVADIAFSVGFRSVSHFFRSFQERYGVTPGEYRNSAVGGIT